MLSLPKPLKIRCPQPDCGYEWMRVRSGVLRSDGTLLRVYVCPICGETEKISRRVGQPPVFQLKR